MAKFCFYETAVIDFGNVQLILYKPSADKFAFPAPYHVRTWTTTARIHLKIDDWTKLSSKTQNAELEIETPLLTLLPETSMSTEYCMTAEERKVCKICHALSVRCRDEIAFATLSAVSRELHVNPIHDSRTSLGIEWLYF